MDILDLPEAEINAIKDQLLADGTIFETAKVKPYDAKFFETVTMSNTLIKFFLFFSVFIIAFIVVAIFSNINTNKKKRRKRDVCQRQAFDF